MNRENLYTVDGPGPSRPHSAVAMRTLVANTGTANDGRSTSSFELEDLSDVEKGKVRFASQAFKNKRRARRIEHRTQTDSNLMEMKRIDSRTSELGVSTSAQNIYRTESSSGFDMNSVVRKAMIFKKFLAENEEKERLQKEEDYQKQLADQVFNPPPEEMNNKRYQVVDVEPILTEDAELLVQEPASCQKLFKHKCLDLYMRIRHACYSPMGRFYYFWTMLVALGWFFVSEGVFYNTIGMAIFVFQEVLTNGFWHWFWLNMFFDGIFWIDIFVQTKKAYMFNGREVHEPSKTRKNYLKEPAAVFGTTVNIRGHEFGTRFLFDLFSCLPYDIPVLYFARNFSLIRLLRIFKAHRLYDFVEETQRRAPMPQLTKIAFLMSACYILFHWNACIYFDISNREGLTEEDVTAFGFSYYKVFNPLFPNEGECNADDYESCLFVENYTTLDLDDERPKYIKQLYTHWLNRSYKLDLGNFSREYSMSMYWSALTITTCGQQPYPNTSVQNILEVVDTLIGVLVFATIIGSVGSVVTNLNHNTYEVRKKLDNIKLYMQSRGVELNFQKHIMNCFLYMNGQHLLNDEKQLLHLLPTRLQAEIAITLHLEVLTKVRIFQGCSMEFLHELMKRLKQHTYNPNNYLCEIGEKARLMFIVKTGVLRVLDDVGEETRLLKEGDTFGEFCMVRMRGKFADDGYPVALRTVGFADVYTLDQDVVSEVMQEYPTDRQKMLDNGEKWLQEQNPEIDIETVNKNRSPVELLFEDFTEFMDDRRFLTVEEQLDRAKEIMVEIDSQLDQLYNRFTTNSQDMKRRVTQLEVIHNKNKKRIKTDFLREELKEEIVRRRRERSQD